MSTEKRPYEPVPCCGGRCKRKQAPMLMRSGLTDQWYVVLRYEDKGDGLFVALDKHELHPVSARQLDALLADHNGPSLTQPGVSRDE